MYGPWITPEMIAAALKHHEAKVAALTPEEKAWLSAEDAHKHTLARLELERQHALYADLDALLEEDIRVYGEPAR